MSVPLYDPKNLWAMPSQNFNEWRATNDLPLLFAYFETKLPGFSKWLDTLPISREMALRVVPTGDLFHGNEVKTLIERRREYTDSNRIEIFDSTTQDAKTYWENRGEQAIVLGKFEPYLIWAKKTLGEARFIVSDALNSGRSDSFVFGLWSGSSPGVLPRAHLFKEFEVLKLGNSLLNGFIDFGNRNLDFTDLDFLQVRDAQFASAWANISFSSCREISICNSRIAFIRFRECVASDFSVEASTLQDIFFEESDVNDLRVTNAKIYRMGFDKSRVTPYITNSDIREFRFCPPPNTPASAIATTYRLLRSAYQSTGMRRESADSYYHERIFERKSYFKPYLNYENRNLFPQMHYDGSIFQVFRMRRIGTLPKKDLIKALRLAFGARLKLWFQPKSFVNLARFKLKWLASVLEYLLWGYGERPFRIALVAGLVIGTYATAYRFMSWPGRPSLDWVDSLYFSVVTFTTLGYGDIAPLTTALKIVTASEALFGAFFIGLVVAGFSNRARY